MLSVYVKSTEKLAERARNDPVMQYRFAAAGTALPKASARAPEYTYNSLKTMF